VKLPLRLISPTIKALGLKADSDDAHQLRIAALLGHSPPELVKAMSEAYRISASR
jgi:hypothetical protein